MWAEMNSCRVVCMSKLFLQVIKTLWEIKVAMGKWMSSWLAFNCRQYTYITLFCLDMPCHWPIEIAILYQYSSHELGTTWLQSLLYNSIAYHPHIFFTIYMHTTLLLEVLISSIGKATWRFFGSIILSVCKCPVEETRTERVYVRQGEERLSTSFMHPSIVNPLFCLQATAGQGVACLSTIDSPFWCFADVHLESGEICLPMNGFLQIFLGQWWGDRLRNALTHLRCFSYSRSGGGGKDEKS